MVVGVAVVPLHDQGARHCDRELSFMPRAAPIGRLFSMAGKALPPPKQA
jgi:hypothetical protein